VGEDNGEESRLLTRRFHPSTIVTIILLLGLGAVSGRTSPRLAVELPAPLIKGWEQANLDVFLPRVVGLAIVLWRAREKRRDSVAQA
jgi:hypothetical protein